MLPGVQAAYEPPLAPELVVAGDAGTPDESAALVLGLLERNGWLTPALDLYQAVVDQGLEATIFADRDGMIRIWNARAEALFGYAAGEAVGKSLDLIIPQHLREAHWQGYRRAIAAGRTRSDGKPMLTRAMHKDGGKLYVELAFGVVTAAGHQVLGALATARPSEKR